MKIILASKSPRRKEIMDMLMWDYSVVTKDTDESMDEQLSLDENLKNLAYKKAFSVAKEHKTSIVIGADTIVYAEGKILGKPHDEEDARKMLKIISSAPHYVCTGVCILNLDRGIDIRFVEKTSIVMSKMTSEEIDWYINTNEWEGKAGAYAIQGKGGIFIKEVCGDFYNVVGLPVNRVYRELKTVLSKEA